MLIAGTISNNVKLAAMNSQWQRKKESKDVLSKKERNERANWTEEERMVDFFQQQLEQDKEASANNEVANKVMSGERITLEEEKYLEKNNPSLLQKYRQIQQEKKAFKEKLKNCKTKDDVERFKMENLGSTMSAFKKIENNPNIPKSEKFAKAQEMIAKTNNIVKVVKEFKASEKYASMPTDAEKNEQIRQEADVASKTEADTVKKPEADVDTNADDKVKVEAKTASKTKNKDDTKETSQEIIDEIQNIYNRIKLKIDVRV